MLKALLLGVLFAIASISAQAQDFILERSYYDDLTAQLSLDEVKQKELTPFEGMLSRGYGKSRIWIKLRIDPSLVPQKENEANEHLILRIRPTYIDDIELFDPLLDPQQRWITGDRHPYSRIEQTSLSPNFIISRGSEARDIWLSVQSTSTRLIEVSVFTVSEVVGAERIEEHLYLAYLAIVLLTLFWATLNFYVSRDRIIGIFIAKQVAGLFWGLAIFGYIRFYLSGLAPNTSVDPITSFIVLSYTAIAAFFDFTVLEEYQAPRSTRWIKYLYLSLFVIELILGFGFGEMALALRINASAVVPGILIVFILACLAKPKKDSISSVVPKWFLVLVYGIIASVMGLAILAMLGFPTNSIALYASMLHGLLTGVLILIFLQIRLKGLVKLRARTELDLEKTRLLLEHEKKSRDDQARLLAMLGHELKTPLAVVQMLMTESSTFREPDIAKAAVSDMNAVIDRAIQANQLDGQQVHLHLEYSDIGTELNRAIAKCSDPGRIVVEAPDETRFWTDRYFLGAILSNLLENACKYSEPATPVEISAQVGEETLQISIANLPGVAGWPDASRVFERYYRSNKARRWTGSGLGLYLVSGFARALGGDVRYEPTSEQIIFTLFLPMKETAL